MNEKLNKLLNDYGAVLIRSKKHKVYRLPNGRNFVCSSTCGDSVSGEQNQIRDLKKALGLLSTGGKIGQRRTKKNGNGRTEVPHYEKSINPLAEKLSLAGVTESALQDSLEILNQQNLWLGEELNAECPCWWCGFLRFFRN